MHLLTLAIFCFLVSCPGPQSNIPQEDTRSTDNAISDLMVIYMEEETLSQDEAIWDAELDPPGFTVSVEYPISSAAISFAKPLGATASFRSPDGAATNFYGPAQCCEIPQVSFCEGNNLFFITIISESGSAAVYDLVVCRLAAEAIPVASIELSDALINIGETVALIPNVLPLEATEKRVTWSSLNTAVATVNSGGVVTGVSRGVATIRATASDGSGVSGTASITVRSTANGISDLKVNSVAAIGASPGFTASVAYDVASAEIAFTKPPGATATVSGSVSGSVSASFGNREATVCTIPFAEFGVGPNLINITITSESGAAAANTLTVTRAEKPKEIISIAINWEEGTDLISHVPVTLSKSAAGYPSTAIVSIIGGIPGPFEWYVDGIRQEGHTGSSFTFTSQGRPAKPCNIGILAGNVYGDAITINILE